MRKVGSRELKNRLGKYLARVRKGQKILVTDRGQPVAVLSPVEPPRHEDALEARLRELEAQGHIRLATQPLEDFKPVRLKGKSLSRMIIEDRK